MLDLVENLLKKQKEKLKERQKQKDKWEQNEEEIKYGQKNAYKTRVRFKR